MEFPIQFENEKFEPLTAYLQDVKRSCGASAASVLVIRRRPGGVGAVRGMASPQKRERLPYRSSRYSIWHQPEKHMFAWPWRCLRWMETFHSARPFMR